MRRAFLLAVAFSAVAAASVPAAEAPPMALGNGGEVFRIVQGAHGSIVPGAPAATAGNAALALEVTRPGHGVERQLIPGTDDAAVEKYPALSVDRTSNTVFVVWEAVETIHSTLHLTAFDDAGDWSATLELTGDPFSFKTRPQLVATADDYLTLDESGEAVTHNRVILHIVWWDQGGDGERALYTSLLAKDGVLEPTWDVYPLIDFLPAAGSVGNGPVGFYSMPQVFSADDRRAAIISFGDRGGNRVATIEVAAVPGSLVALADEARAQIIDTGRNFVGPRSAFAAKARAQIIDTGRRLVAPEVAAFLATATADLILAAEADVSFEALAEKARAQIIDTGARLTRGPRLMVDKSTTHIVEGDPVAEQGGRLSQFRILSVRETPHLPERAVRTLTSGTGEDLVLAWDVDGAVRYRQSHGEGWSDVRTLTLDASLSREQAYEILQKRLDRR